MTWWRYSQATTRSFRVRAARTARRGCFPVFRLRPPLTLPSAGCTRTHRDRPRRHGARTAVACASFDIDIISLDLSGRLNFPIKFGPVHQAVQRGVYFEIVYAPVLQSAGTGPRARASPSRASLFGLSATVAKACLSTNARAVLYHAGVSRHRTPQRGRALGPLGGT